MTDAERRALAAALVASAAGGGRVIVSMPHKAGARALMREVARQIPTRCIGCGRFVARSANWNQCADCRDDYSNL